MSITDNNKEKVLIVKNLNKFFDVENNFFQKIKNFFLRLFGKKTNYQKKVLKAVNNVSFEVYKKEILCIVGESGCGKTTLARTILNLHKPTSGKIILNGETINNSNLKYLRKKCQMIFQDPYSSLNPFLSVGDIISEPFEIYNIFKDKNERKNKILELMNLVGLSNSYFERYPVELSGGQRQRIGIARSLALNPDLIICDEPISALDVSIQAQILNTFIDLKNKLGLTYIFITHNLLVVKNIADRVIVMYLGNIVELTTSKKIFEHPMHPYTKLLINSILIPDPKYHINKENLEPSKNKYNDISSIENSDIGCPFKNRCNKVTKECLNKKPELKEIEEGHFVACFNHD